MYPTLLKLHLPVIGNFEITTFGLMMFLAFIVGGWVLTRQFRRSGLTDELASWVVRAAAVGGIVGAKVYYAVLFRDWHLLFDRAGLVWYGGLIGGVVGCWFLLWRRKVDFLTAADATVPSLAIGYALGRIGCFLVGDDYGAPTNSWVGVAFPKGSPPTTCESLHDFGVKVNCLPGEMLKVHPTQLYESAAAVGFPAALPGLAGGLIVSPVLPLLLHVAIRLAIGASIISVIATSSGAAAAYVKERLANIRVAMFLELGTASGAIAGAYLAGLVHPRWLYILFGAMLGYSAAAMLRGIRATPSGEPAGALSDWLRLNGSY